MTTAVVLGAGGARGAFEIGAARCLVTEFDVAPDVVTGVSAGALVAAKLAEGGDVEARLGALNDLQAFLHNLHAAEDLFELRDWLEQIRDTPIGREIAEYLSPTGTHQGRRSMMAHVVPIATSALRTLITDIPKLRQALGFFADHGNSFFSAEPLRSRLRGADGRAALVNPEAIAGSGVRLRIGLVSLETGKLRYATESAHLVEREQIDGPLGRPVDLYDAVLASAAQPILFPPIPLAGETYVDGGVLQIVPLEPALDLGADSAYVIVASALELAPPPAKGYENADLVTLLRRTSNDIPLWENVQRGLYPPDRDRARVVEIVPSFNVLGVTDTDPGLIAIADDYGYMRAADAVVEARSGAARTRARRLSDAIASLRKRCWELENDLRNSSPVDRGPALGDLRLVKTTLSRAVAQRLDDECATPEGARDWYERWERHAEPVAFAESPWHRLGAEPIDVEAFAPPKRRIRLAESGADHVLSDGNLVVGPDSAGDDLPEEPLILPDAAFAWLSNAMVRA